MKSHNLSQDLLADPGFAQGGHTFSQYFADVESQYWLGSRALLRALEALAFLTQICILPLFLVLFCNIFNVHLCGYINKYLFQHERF